MTRQQAAYLATALLFLSLFMPLINMPMMGAVTFVRFAGGIPGIVMGIAVIVAAIASARRSYRALLIPAFLTAGSLGFVIWQFVELKRGMAYTPTRAEDSFSRGLDALTQGMTESIQLQWGVGVGLLAMVMLFAIALSRRSSGELRDPVSNPS